MKYFISQGHSVYSITFPKKNQQQIEINGLIHIELPELFINQVFLLKRVVFGWHIYKITKRREVCKIAHIPDYIILSKKIKKSGHEQIHDN